MSQDFPLLEDFLEQRCGTVYMLSDPPGRLRDGLSVVVLSRFFASRGVDVLLQPVLANHRRYINALSALAVLSEDGDLETVDKLLKGIEPVKERVKRFFRLIEDRWVKRATEGEPYRLAPRGPVLLLGRPQLYPASFLDQIERELPPGAGITSRFQMEGPKAHNQDFWAIRDRHFDLTIPKPQDQRDLAVIRKVCGPFSRRTFLFAYGTSSLGTLAAIQTLTDQDLGEVLVKEGVTSLLQQHRSVEILVDINLHTERAPVPPAGLGVPGSDRSMLWTTDLDPRQIRLVAGPLPPISSRARDWMDRFESNCDLDSVYQLAPDSSNEVRRYEVVGIHPNPKAGPYGWYMIGGNEVASCVESLRRLVDSGLRQPILLTGRTGTGKELGARIVFQQRVCRLLRRLARGEEQWPMPVVGGSRLTETNCAAVTESLAEAEFFGVRRKTASDVAARPGQILGAGEGVAFLDELSFMDPRQLGRLLRAIQPPYGVRPVGLGREIPAAAQLVAAMSEDLDQLLDERRMLPELAARLRPGLVCLPCLEERPGDIPALLAHLAGETVEMTQTALRCVLAGVYPDNVRELVTIIERARRLRPSGTGPLPITLDALGVRDAVERLTALGVQPRGERRYVFQAPHSNPIRGAVFGLAAEVLTALENDGKTGLSSRCGDLSTGRQLRADQHSLVCPQDCVTAWYQALQLIMQETGAANGRPARQEFQHELLDLMASLTALRFIPEEAGSDLDCLRPFASWLKKAPPPSLTQSVIAHSLRGPGKDSWLSGRVNAQDPPSGPYVRGGWPKRGRRPSSRKQG